MKLRNWKTTWITIAVLALAALAASVAVAGGGSHAKSSKVPNHAISTKAAVQDNPTPGDGDTVQSGDQTAPDTAGAADSSTDSETADAGEPAGGHANPAGAADHQCTGNCLE